MWGGVLSEFVGGFVARLYRWGGVGGGGQEGIGWPVSFHRRGGGTGGARGHSGQHAWRGPSCSPGVGGRLAQGPGGRNSPKKSTKWLVGFAQRSEDWPTGRSCYGVVSMPCFGGERLESLGRLDKRWGAGCVAGCKGGVGGRGCGGGWGRCLVRGRAALQRQGSRGTGGARLEGGTGFHGRRMHYGHAGGF